MTGAVVQEILERDLRDGQYFVTGNLTKELFDDNCRSAFVFRACRLQWPT